MIYRIATLISILFVLAACQNEDGEVEVITFNPYDYNVIFIPENKVDDKNEIYIDAMIELKAEYPSEFNNVNKIEKDLTAMGIKESNDGPTLVILKSGETIAKLSGKMPKHEIKEQLEITLADNK
ncbi:hypothetical protein [Oceanobacillus massiliensis]|uniref:hypothetical protein n=1 Tax=Oceanobacillus massiliensis TaxID=1465765 RepID=UPI00301962FA